MHNEYASKNDENTIYTAIDGEAVVLNTKNTLDTFNSVATFISEEETIKMPGIRGRFAYC